MPRRRGRVGVFGQWPADPFCRFGSVRFLRTDRGSDRPAACFPGLGRSWSRDTGRRAEMVIAAGP